MQPSTVCINKQLDPLCSQQTYHRPNQPQKAFSMTSSVVICISIVVFNVPHEVILETIFPASHLSGANISLCLPNQSLGCYEEHKYNYNQVTTHET